MRVAVGHQLARAFGQDDLPQQAIEIDAEDVAVRAKGTGPHPPRDCRTNGPGEVAPTACPGRQPVRRRTRGWHLAQFLFGAIEDALVDAGRRGGHSVLRLAVERAGPPVEGLVAV